jgi:gas vesicle GvpC-like protein
MNKITKRKPRRPPHANPDRPVKSVAKTRPLVSALLAWFATNARDLPWRRTGDPYAIWVSEIMLQQTQVKTVIPYWERWMRELPTIESLANTSADKIHKLWEGLGYYTRVRNMQKAAQQIIAAIHAERAAHGASQKRELMTPMNQIDDALRQAVIETLQDRVNLGARIEDDTRRPVLVFLRVRQGLFEQMRKRPVSNVVQQ